MLAVAMSLGDSAVVSRFIDTIGHAPRTYPGTIENDACFLVAPQSTSRGRTSSRLDVGPGGLRY